MWRYPVKSLGGERLQGSPLTGGGLPGDRIVAVLEPASRRPEHPVSARDLPALLAFQATWEEGQALVSGPGLDRVGHRDPRVGVAVSEYCGRRLRLQELAEPWFDDAPIHLVNLASLRRLGSELKGEVDHRRFRANLYLEAADSEAGCETGWEGVRVALGGACLEVLGGCPRCALTTRDPDNPDSSWPLLLRHLVRTRGELMGVYLRAVSEGPVGEGDVLRLEALA